MNAALATIIIEPKVIMPKNMAIPKCTIKAMANVHGLVALGHTVAM